MVFNLLIY